MKIEEVLIWIHTKGVMLDSGLEECRFSRKFDVEFIENLKNEIEIQKKLLAELKDFITEKNRLIDTMEKVEKL